jgi:hypothetical protein
LGKIKEKGVAMKKKNEEKRTPKKQRAKEPTKGEIITDPFGSYTGVCVDDKYARPVQDADDL